MSPAQLAALLRYRLTQAHESLRKAEILPKQEALRGTINRAYYAMFYALLALLATEQLGRSKHSSPLRLFDREFVKPGRFDWDLICARPVITEKWWRLVGPRLNKAWPLPEFLWKSSKPTL